MKKFNWFFGILSIVFLVAGIVVTSYGQTISSYIDLFSGIGLMIAGAIFMGVATRYLG